MVRENYPGVNLLENKRNLGACRARNRGIEASHGDWVLTLDSDALLAEGFLNEIAGFIHGLDKTVGMLQPKVLNSDGKTVYSCGIYFSKLARFYDIGKGRPASRFFNAPGFIFGPCSATALYRRSMLDQIKDANGYFDQRFFFLVEDVDLAFRAQEMGWKALYYPQLVSYHRGNSSSLSRSMRQFFCWRNRRLLLNKLRLGNLRSGAVYAFYDLPRLIFLFLTNSYVRQDIWRKLIPSVLGK